MNRISIILSLLHLLACSADLSPQITSVEAQPFLPQTPPISLTDPRGAFILDVSPVLPQPSIASELSESSIYGKESSRQMGLTAMEFLGTLTKRFSPRASASEQETTAAKFLESWLQTIGYEVYLQIFNTKVEKAKLSFSTNNKQIDKGIEGLRLDMSAFGEAVGMLANVGQANKPDLRETDLSGKIALIQRGSISFDEKITHVTKLGAVGAVIYNNQGNAFRGTLINPGTIPVISISYEDGNRLAERIANSETKVTLSAKSIVRESINVVAEKEGSNPLAGTIILGAHYDTVPNVPGANDNGSGIAALMVIAQEIWHKPYPFTIRFILFGSEEIGLLGSEFYVDSLNQDELRTLKAMINFDSLGTGNVSGVLGDADIVGRVLDLGRQEEIEVRQHFYLSEGTSSDHDSFKNRGIPVLFFLSNDLSHIHTTEDKLSLVEPDLLGDAITLTLGLLDNFPQR